MTEDTYLPETVLQFGDIPRAIIQQQILERNPYIRERRENREPESDNETEEQRRRRVDRKARNRTAARKCRERKEKTAQDLELEVERLEKEKANRRTEIEKLVQDVARLQRLVSDHRCVLNNNNNVVVGGDMMDPEAEAADTPTDETECLTLIYDSHYDEPVHQEARDDAPTIDDLVQRPPEEEEGATVFENDTLNTPVVEMTEIYFNL